VTHSLKAQKHIAEIESMHRVARERFELSTRETKAQADYLAEVTAQLLGSSTEPAETAKARPPRVAQAGDRV
jgi:hypothetical protein